MEISVRTGLGNPAPFSRAAWSSAIGGNFPVRDKRVYHASFPVDRNAVFLIIYTEDVFYVNNTSQ
jgi:hypothetical protein